MGFFRERVLGLDAKPAQSFAVGDDLTDDQRIAFGLEPVNSPVAAAPKVSRSLAMQVPAVKLAHDRIAGVLGGLPIALYGPNNAVLPSTFLAQPEVSVPRSITMTRLVADLMFEGTVHGGIAWWRVTRRDFTGRPANVERLAPHRVVVSKGRIWIDGTEATEKQRNDLIRFDSPFPGLLTAGARAIRTALILDSAAARYADGAPPADYFEPAEGVDPFDGDETKINAMLDGWTDKRRQRTTAYVPAALKYNIAGWTPEKLQLADARNHAVLEVARLTGVDPEELGVGQSSRTYYNAFDRRKSFIDFVLGGYRQAVEDRLSMQDVTAYGSTVRFDLSAFLRSDDQARFDAYGKGLEVGVYADKDEVRAAEGKPPLNAPAAPSAGRLRAVPNDPERAVNA